MDFFTTLKDTPVPTLLVIGGFIFLFLGIATIKKPIVIDVQPKSNRRLATIFGAFFIVAGLYTLLQSPIKQNENVLTETPALAVAQNTDTPIPISTVTQSSSPDTITPTSAPVSGFENNCINSNIWTPYTINVAFPKSDNCWDMTSRGISAYDNKLLISVDNSIEQSGSISIALPKSGIVNFTVKVDQFNIGESYGDLVFGLGNNANWLQDGKFIFLRVTKPDSPIYFVYGTAVTRSGDQFINNYEKGSVLNVTFEIYDSILNIYANNTKVVENISLSPSDKELFWIGYRLPKNAQLVAFVSNFSIIEE